MKYIIIGMFFLTACNADSGNSPVIDSTKTKVSDTPESNVTDTFKQNLVNYTSEATKALTNPQLWRIDDSTAKGMMANYHNDRLNKGYMHHSGRKYNTVKKAIENLFQGQKPRFKFKNARYVSQIDEDRYRRLRGFPPTTNPEEDYGAVMGSATEIYRVISTTQKMINSKKVIVADTSYFDFVDACPPPYPPECDKKDKDKKDK